MVGLLHAVSTIAAAELSSLLPGGYCSPFAGIKQQHTLFLWFRHPAVCECRTRRWEWDSTRLADRLPENPKERFVMCVVSTSLQIAILERGREKWKFGRALISLRELLWCLGIGCNSRRTADPKLLSWRDISGGRGNCQGANLGPGNTWSCGKRRWNLGRA